MLYFRIENEKVVEIADSIRDRRHEGWAMRHDFVDMAKAEEVAASASEHAGERYIAVDSGASTWPRYDVIRAPKVGDEVSYGFNGDYYPDGKIARISESLRVIATDTGHKYYRRRETGSWKRGCWGLVGGHHDERNPHF